MATTAIIIPAYNEEKRIEKTLRSYAAVFAHAGDVQLVVVVNNTTDNTVGVVQSIQKDFPEFIQLIDIREKVGKGGAIIAGFQSVIDRVEWVGFVDADGATPAAEYQRLLGLAQGHDGLIAARWLPASTITGRDSLRRRLGSIAFHLLVRALFWMPYHDTQCGAKMFRARALRTVLPQLGTVRNMVFDVELLYRLRKVGYDVVEASTEWHDQAGSTVLVGADSLEMARTLLGFRWRTLWHS